MCLVIRPCDAGIPTSQQPVSQQKFRVHDEDVLVGYREVGYQHTYVKEIPENGKIRRELWAVTNQTTDRVPGHGPHWETGMVKQSGATDGAGRLRIYNETKEKIEYE